MIVTNKISTKVKPCFSRLKLALPKDPFTGTNDTWQFKFVPNNPDQTGAASSDNDEVHSGSDLIGTDGTPYNSW